MLNESNYNELNFESIQIGLASPDTIRAWSYGEVKKAETINYRTLKPEKDGLYCERIFGPQKDWECHCGKYKRMHFKGKTCERCGVTITKSKVRRERMGHIELACPVSHIWYFKGIPSRMGLILDISPKELDNILYFAKYLVTGVAKYNVDNFDEYVYVVHDFPDKGKSTPLTKAAYDDFVEEYGADAYRVTKTEVLLGKKPTLTEDEYHDYVEKYGENAFRVSEVKSTLIPPLVEGQVMSVKEYDDAVEKYGIQSFRAKMGAEAVQELLKRIDVDMLGEQLKAELDEATGQKRTKIIKRLEVVESFRQSNQRPEWMILTVLPVIPPDLRPMVQLDGGRFATSDLNDLYRRVINRNERLKRLFDLGAPEIIVKNEKRMLQEAVDALIDNGRHNRPVTGANSRPLKSLSDMLKGKQGRFRQNLLGKRVDYSGRSVIVVGPELKIYQCGLPKEMALELFKPFVIKRLVEKEIAKNIKNAKKMVDRAGAEVWDALEVAIKDHPVMLNRAPTLHRLGIQAFEPVLVEGRAIKLHPLACTAFNADFDGDQMAVHVPLSAEAQAEARFLMLAANNLLKPSDGKPVAVPSQDMVLGSYYLTLEKSGATGEGKVFRDVNEAIMAYDEGDLDLHARCKIRMTKEIDGKTVSKLIETTLGRVIFNDPIPQDLGIVDRSDPERAFNLEVDYLVGKKQLGKIIDKAIKAKGIHEASEMLDKIKNQGYKYSTRSGITVSVFDAIIPENKKKYLAEAQAKVDKVNALHRKGLASDKDRSKYTISAWEECTAKVQNEITVGLSQDNPIFMMVDSGARGSTNQLGQLAGMRGLIANTAGKTIEIPIRANYREGLNVLEYFISSRGARKGLADTALRTADSGYLTRRLVDVSQEVIIREEDCGCTEGLTVSAIKSEDNSPIEPLDERLVGRYLLHPFHDPETGELLVDNDHMLTDEEAKMIADTGIEKVVIRSLLTCRSKEGVCIKCYGKNLATGNTVQIGEAVGIIAAQSIGEPGTQLTMRTFHTGGVTSSADITQGLPRVEELFEARKPKILAMLSEIEGVVSFEEVKKNSTTVTNVVVTNKEEQRRYLIPYDSRICVVEGQFIEKGAPITDGSVNPHDVLDILGVDAVHNYLIREVQLVYRLQGVEINDKHIEVIVRQMMRKMRIVDPGDTKLLPGTSVEKGDFIAANDEIRQRVAETGEDLHEATADAVLLGITKASLATDSFLSAASFQETTRVLTDAAIKGKKDPLRGLKENVIIGKLLPSGTGMKCYNDVDIEVFDEGDDYPVGY